MQRVYGGEGWGFIGGFGCIMLRHWVSYNFSYLSSFSFLYLSLPFKQHPPPIYPPSILLSPLSISLHIIIQIQRMRSQYYIQSTLETFPKKPPAPHYPSKSRPNPSLLNSKTRSRHPHSRDMTASLSIRQSKQDDTANCTRPDIAAQWIEVKCMECEAMRGEQARIVKEMQMHWEEELTEEKERFIGMEKKYLQKEHQLLQMQGDYSQLEGMYMEAQARADELAANNEAILYKLSQAEEQIDKITQQNKGNIEKVDTLHRFLKLYLEQTKLLVSWAHLLEQLKEDLPATVHAVREEMIDRRPDCEATIKEISTLQRLSFSNIAAKEQPSAFFQQDQGSESFMKYLKQSRPKPSAKKANSFLDSTNKQNIDSLNSLPSRSLFPQSRPKHRPPLSDEFLRVLFLQAKALEGGQSGWITQGTREEERSIED